MENAVTRQKKIQEETINAVLSRVNDFQNSSQLTLPQNYSPENALKAAWFELQEVTDKDGKKALDVCNKDSILNSLFKMIVLGLNPMKKQCAFIVYKDNVSLTVEYHGNIALAKRYGNVKDVIGHVIYEGDTFKFTLDIDTGDKVIVEHKMDIKNINYDKIKGAYAIVITNSGRKYVEIMNIHQIEKSWEQGPMKGNSPAHKNFPDQMAIKTVVNRACKLFITSSDDGSIINQDERPKIDNQPPENDANSEPIDIESEEIEVEKPKDEKEEGPKGTGNLNDLKDQVETKF